ncbi:hypothetical protein [Streptomyces sp. Agncl-13]|uniref:hypothetical protein n=1 Tax=Streptomyces sp. Agncl-13 TaxID=3400628 RepID=UPI003A864F36
MAARAASREQSEAVVQPVDRPDVGGAPGKRGEAAVSARPQVPSGITTHLRMADETGALKPEQLDDLRACLYGLHSVLRLHFSQEEESYFSLAP